MIPDQVITFSWLLGSAVVLVGMFYIMIWLGWVVYHQVDLLDDRKRAETNLIQVQTEHRKKLLDLEFQKAKTMNDQIIAASKE